MKHIEALAIIGREPRILIQTAIRNMKYYASWPDDVGSTLLPGQQSTIAKKEESSDVMVTPSKKAPRSSVIIEDEAQLDGAERSVTIDDVDGDEEMGDENGKGKGKGKGKNRAPNATDGETPKSPGKRRSSRRSAGRRSYVVPGSDDDDLEEIDPNTSSSAIHSKKKRKTRKRKTDITKQEVVDGMLVWTQRDGETYSRGSGKKGEQSEDYEDPKDADYDEDDDMSDEDYTGELNLTLPGSKKRKRASDGGKPMTVAGGANSGKGKAKKEGGSTNEKKKKGEMSERMKWLVALTHLQKKLDAEWKERREAKYGKKDEKGKKTTVGTSTFITAAMVGGRRRGKISSSRSGRNLVRTEFHRVSLLPSSLPPPQTCLGGIELVANHFFEFV